MAESSNVLSSVVQEVLYREVSADMRKVDQYHRMPRDHWRSVRRLGVSIAELRDSEDLGDGDVTLGLLERLRLDNVEKAVHLHIMMKETKVKIAEKNVCIRRLRRNGAVGVNLLLEASLKYVGVCRLLCMLVVSMVGCLCKCIEELKALSDRQGIAESVRFMEGLQADEMDRCNRTLSFIREVEVEAREKSRGRICLGMLRAFLLCDCSIKSGYKDCLFKGREISNDMRLGTKINALCARLTVIINERSNFVNELNMLSPEFMPVKMVELMKQIQDKDIRNLLKLQTLGREFELRVWTSVVFMSYLLILLLYGLLRVCIRIGLRYEYLEAVLLLLDLGCSGFLEWHCTEVLRYFCHKAATEDRKFAMRMNLLRQEIADVCEYRRNLADELCSIRSVIALVNAVELLNDTLLKDGAKMEQLCELERQLELRALEKELFIQKLVQNGPF
nr:hypothetical protein [Tanacetum cinerariifolium]